MIWRNSVEEALRRREEHVSAIERTERLEVEKWKTVVERDLGLFRGRHGGDADLYAKNEAL